MKNDNIPCEIFSMQVESLGNRPALIFGPACLASSIASIWSILAIQTDLLIKLRWPMKQHTGELLNTNRSRIITVLIWIVSFGLAYGVKLINVTYGLNESTLSYGPMLERKVENEEGSNKNTQNFLKELYLLSGITSLLGDLENHQTIGNESFSQITTGVADYWQNLLQLSDGESSRLKI